MNKLLQACFSAVAQIIGTAFGPLMNAVFHFQDFLYSSLPKPLNHIAVSALQLIVLPLLLWPVSAPWMIAAVFVFWGRLDSFLELMRAGSPAIALIVLRLAWGVYYRSADKVPNPHEGDICWDERVGYLSFCVCAALLVVLLMPQAQPFWHKVLVFAFYEWICYLSYWVAPCPLCPQF